MFYITNPQKNSANTKSAGGQEIRGIAGLSFSLSSMFRANNVQDCWTCCRKEDEDVLQTLKAEANGKPVPARNGENLSLARQIDNHESFANDICLRVCWPEKPQCPDGWVRHLRSLFKD
jgi:hypothetical protein